MQTSTLLAAGKIKRKYAKGKKNAIRKKLLKQDKEFRSKEKKRATTVDA